MKKLAAALSFIVFFNSFVQPCLSYSLAVDFLVSNGIKLYNQGKYDDALKEFKKTLLLETRYSTALEYIRKIESIKNNEIYPVAPRQAITRTSRKKPAVPPSREKKMAAALKEKEAKPGQKAKPKAYPAGEKKLEINIDSIDVNQPIEIEQGKSIVISGDKIKRFLITEEGPVIATKEDNEGILVTGRQIGYSYMHVWDDLGRRTFSLLTIPATPEGTSLEDEMLRESREARNFKLGYSLDWALYESGRSLNSLGRTDYYYVHNLYFSGLTPYGNLDSSITVNRFESKTDLSHYTIGLTNGRFGNFKGFTIRGFDFFDIPPDFANISFPGASLRGGMIESPAFNNRLKYTLFYGRENLTGYGNLAPILTATRKSYLDGLNLTYQPSDKQDYKFTFVHGFGPDRLENLNAFGYDLTSNWKLGNWNTGVEVAHDSESFASLLRANYYTPKFSFSSELRNINKDFLSMSGSSWRQGELGGLFNVTYNPMEKLEIRGSLDVFRDRLFPAKDNDTRWNEDLNLFTTYRLDPNTAFRLNYMLQNDLGRINEYRYENAEAGFSKTFKFFRDINFFANYYHQENTNYASPSSDYINDRIYSGIKFMVVKDLYFYMNKEMNWLQERFTGNSSTPNALETGLDWSSRLGKSPFYSNTRFTYRDEEGTGSPLSFLSGEDYIEGYSELSFRPNADTELFGSCRIRNVWADNPSVIKRIEAYFNVGLRCLWDLGIRWDPVGDIDGFVFKDFNSDGVMQRNEPPVSGVKVMLGRNRSQVTDVFGYYKFKGIRGRSCFVSLDSATIPTGFVVTVPLSQEVEIEQSRSVRVNFGITSRSEISGYIFEDIDANGEYNQNDKGVKGVIVSLEDGSTAKTDQSGRYYFSFVTPGEHTVSLDMTTLAVYYLPKVPVTKKITLYEGVTYNYNIPLEKNR